MPEHYSSCESERKSLFCVTFFCEFVCLLESIDYPRNKNTTRSLFVINLELSTILFHEE